MPVSHSSAYHFGPFSFYPASRLLLADGQPVRLGARAMDLLQALVERAGEVIAKEELFRRVWPNTVVEETSLRVHVAALRKALGDTNTRYIVNVPGQGYSFAGALERRGHDPAPQPPAVPRSPRHCLPVRLSRMIGRLSSAQGVASALLTRRFVTITGEGGVGKTTLALAVAEESRGEYPDGIAFVDLAALGATDPMISTVGRAIGLLLPPNSPVSALTEALKGLRFLLIVDNCEHLVAEAAALVVDLLRAVPTLRVLTTSREPLRAEGEYVHRLEALPCPPEDAPLSASQALGYDAIQLLVERVRAASDAYVLTDHDAPLAAELCRRLDGIPLAIELAAARVGFFGMEGLLDRLHDRLQLLTSGHRTVMPRHQTLRALYDWSYDLLTEEGRDAFARLAVFPSAFTLDAGLTLMPTTDRAQALSAFLDLIAKSLVAADLGEETRRYRLLDTARVYAMEQLVASGALRDCRLTHATQLIQTLETANLDWERSARRAWLARHGPLMADVMAAFDWLASEDGDAELYARLAGASFQLTQQLSLLDIHQPHLREALRRLHQSPQPRRELALRLTTQLGSSIAHGRPAYDGVQGWIAEGKAYFEAPDISPSLLFSLAVAYFAHGEFRQSLKAAERLELMADSQGDRQTGVIARRLQAQQRYYLGDLMLARRLAEDVLKFPSLTLRYGVHLDPVDRRISMGIVLATISWLEGDAVEADRLVSAVLELSALEIEQSQCMALAMCAIPIALWNGDLALAAQRVEALRLITDRAGLANFWVEWTEVLERIVQGRPIERDVESAMLVDLVGTLNTDYSDARQLARADDGVVGWCAPEVLRRHGERLLQAPEPDEAQVERLFQRALQMARQHGSVRWELRAALSLARFSQARGRPWAAQTLLAPLSRLQVPASCEDARLAAELLRLPAPPERASGGPRDTLTTIHNAPQTSHHEDRRGLAAE